MVPDFKKVIRISENVLFMLAKVNVAENRFSPCLSIDSGFMFSGMIIATIMHQIDISDRKSRRTYGENSAGR